MHSGGTAGWTALPPSGHSAFTGCHSLAAVGIPLHWLAVWHSCAPMPALFEIEQRMERVGKELARQTESSPKAPLIQALQSLRGIGRLTAITLVAEIGTFSRFRSPAQLMAYLGLVSREYSTGLSTRRGSMTKTGNGRARRAVVESAWSYRYRPAVKGDLAERLEGMPAEVQRISWKAQERLHGKYRRLVYAKNKHKNVAIGARVPLKRRA